MLLDKTNFAKQCVTPLHKRETMNKLHHRESESQLHYIVPYHTNRWWVRMGPIKSCNGLHGVTLHHNLLKVVKVSYSKVGSKWENAGDLERVGPQLWTVTKNLHWMPNLSLKKNITFWKLCIIGREKHEKQKWQEPKRKENKR